MNADQLNALRTALIALQLPTHARHDESRRNAAKGLAQVISDDYEERMGAFDDDEIDGDYLHDAITATYSQAEIDAMLQG